MSAVRWKSARTWPAARAALVALALLAATPGCERSEAPPEPSAPAAAPELTFAGAAKCASCHPKDAEAHRGSDHALAMQPADQQTVLGDFRDAVFRHRGVTSTFSRRDGKFLIRTDGPDGKTGRVRDRVHLRREAAAAVSGSAFGRPAPGAQPRLGHAAQGRRRPAVDAPPAGRDARPPGPAALDGARADVELPVRGMSLD